MIKAIIAAFVLTILGVVIIILGARYANQKTQEPMLPASTANEIAFSEVQKRTTLQNCWIVFGGRVFDISRKSEQAESQIPATICGTVVDALPTAIPKDSLTQYQLGILSL